MIRRIVHIDEEKCNGVAFVPRPVTKVPLEWLMARLNY